MRWVRRPSPCATQPGSVAWCGMSRWLASLNGLVLLTAVAVVGTTDRPAVAPVAEAVTAPAVAATPAASALPAPAPASEPAPSPEPEPPAPSPSPSPTATPSPPPPPPRTASATGWQPYAVVGPVVLHAPADVVELVGYHQSGHDGAQPVQPLQGPARQVLLPSRQRDTHPQGATDVVVDPAREVRAPVTGTVLRAGSYTLYCDHRDHYLVVEPDARPGWEVKVLHFEGLRVAAGDRVEAGVTVIGSGARVLPFRSQVDDLTAEPSWPHLHVEVVDPSVPDRPTGGGC
jgi:biotin carboxyl carrier protein